MRRDFLSIESVTPEELRILLGRAATARSNPGSFARALDGRHVALIFEKPSTRTRVSFEVAVTAAGGTAVVLDAGGLQLGRGETIEDTGRALARYVDAIVLRTSAQERLERLAEAAAVPVINALSDDEHPCQALADLQTIEEKRGSLENTTLCYVGDGNNVAHSLMLACAGLGVDVRVASPPGYQPFPRIVERASELAADTGARVTVTHDAGAAAEGAHVLYTDVWTSMGQEGEETARRKALAPYRLDESLLELAARDAIVMHCLPAHRGEEVSAAILDGPRSVVWDQAENRLHSAKALLGWLLED